MNQDGKGACLSVGDTLALLRTRKGMSLADLAERSGLSQEALKHYEDNTWRPGTQALSHLAAALAVEVPELMSGCSVLMDDHGNLLLVRYAGNHQIKVIGTFSEDGKGSGRGGAF